MCWTPERDVILFDHTKEPQACSVLSIYNAKEARYGYYFDDRVRFVLIPREVLSLGMRVLFYVLHIWRSVFYQSSYVKMLEDMNVGGEAVERQVGRCLDVKQRKRWSKIEADRGCCPVREQISYW